MGPVDILILIVLGIGLILGFFKGFVRQITGLAGLIGGGIAAYFVYGWGYLNLAPLIGIAIPPWVAGLILAIIAFFVVSLFFGLLGRMMKKTLKEANLGFFDRFVGAGLGAAKSLVFILLILMLLMITPLKSAILAESESEPVLSLFTGISGSLIDHLLGTSPQDKVVRQLEFLGFDRKCCDQILQDPELIFELARTPGFFQLPKIGNQKSVSQKTEDRIESVRNQVMELIKDSKLTAREKADQILKLLRPAAS